MVSFIYKANLPWIIQFQEQGTKKKELQQKTCKWKNPPQTEKKPTLQLNKKKKHQRIACDRVKGDTMKN